MASRQLTLAFDGPEDCDPLKGEDVARQPDAELLDAQPATPISDIIGNVRRSIRRIRPPVKAHGGKYYLARQIVPVLMSAPGNPTEYLELCAFGASVFLAMPRFQREILGDVNPDVVTLWQTLAHEKLSALLTQRLSDIPYTEAAFQSACNSKPADQVESAAQVIVRTRFSRGGFGKAFAWSERTRGGRPGDDNSWLTFRENTLPEIINRARGVEVVNDACWWTVWESRDSIQRMVYADPPYALETRTAKKAYGPFEMTRLQHFWLIAALRAHSGPAAISGYRCPDYDRWLHDWKRLDFDMPNNAGQGKHKQRRCESLWINW